MYPFEEFCNCTEERMAFGSGVFEAMGIFNEWIPISPVWANAIISERPYFWGGLFTTRAVQGIVFAILSYLVILLLFPSWAAIAAAGGLAFGYLFWYPLILIARHAARRVRGVMGEYHRGLPGVVTTAPFDTYDRIHVFAHGFAKTFGLYEGRLLTPDDAKFVDEEPAYFFTGIVAGCLSIVLSIVPFFYLLGARTGAPDAPLALSLIAVAIGTVFLPVAFSLVQRVPATMQRITRSV